MTQYLSVLQKFARLELEEAEIEALHYDIEYVGNWSEFIRDAELYAISNLVLKHVTEQQFEIPSVNKIGLKALTLRHRSAADARYQVMQALSKKFSEHDIPIIALKGLALAPMIFPADELRPMRDIDVLVPRDKETKAAELIRDLGFILPQTQPSKFMRDSHQLPNATKIVNGFTISLEIHHDALSRDVPGHLFYEDIQASLQTVRWRDLEISTLGHEHMLHQVSRHLEGLHPGAVLKLINVMDVVLYSEKFIDEIDWQLLSRKFPHVLNTLKCLHMIMPLSNRLQTIIGGVSKVQMTSAGTIMQPLTHIITPKNSVSKQLRLLFKPSDWWLHLYYNVDPAKSLWMVRWLRHPLTLMSWIGKRLFSRVMGG